MSEAKKPAGKTKMPTATAYPDARKKGTVVYIGPDIPGAKQYTTYNAGLPDALKEKVKEHPVFDSLIIPAGKLANARTELAREGSALSIIYQKASEKTRKKEE